MKKPLIGIVLFSPAKDYVIDKFYEMATACFDQDLFDVLMVSDRVSPVYRTLKIPSPGWYAEDMLTVGRTEIQKYARIYEHECMIWQGVDCFYKSNRDFERLVSNVTDKGFSAVGGITTARADENFCVLRHFDIAPDGEILETQTDWPADMIDKWVEEGELVSVGGFPGADALVIHNRLYDITFEGHIPWYERVAMGQPNICVEEYWCKRVLEAGHEIMLDPTVLTWHVHDVDHIARMWRGITKPMDELSWEE